MIRTASRLFRSFFSPQFRHPRNRRPHHLLVELLEDRTVPSTWVGGGFAGDCHGTTDFNVARAWSNPANWFGGVPGAGDPAVFTHNVSYTTCDGHVQTGPAAGPGLDGSYTIGALQMDSTFGLGLGSSDGRNTLTFGGMSQIASGNLGGLQLVNNGTLTLSGCTLGIGLTNNGTVLQTGTVGVNSSTINNAAGAVWDLQNDANISFVGLVLNFSSVNNSGTFRKSTGTGTSSIAGAGLVTFSNTGGTLDVRSGTLYFQTERSTGGTLQVSPGALIDLDSLSPGGITNGTYSGTYTVSGGGNVQVASGHDCRVGGPSGATFNFNAGSFQWTGGTIEAGAGLTVNGTLDLTGSVNLNGPLTNGGTIVQTGHLNFTGGSLNNPAGHLYDLQTDDTYSGTINSGQSTLNNAGTFRKSAGTGTADLSVVGFNNNGGILDVESGTLKLGGGSETGSTFLVATGAVLNPSGAEVLFAGSCTGSGGGLVQVSAGPLDVAAGGATFNFPAGMFLVAGSAVHGPGVLTNMGFITLTSLDAQHTLVPINTTLTNLGTIDQMATIPLDGGTVNNQAGGLWDVQEDVGFSIGLNSSGGPFNNAGTFRKSGGTGTAAVNSTDFNNAGTVEVRSGTLLLHDGVDQVSGGTLSGGTWSVFAGSTLTIRVTNITINAATVNLSGAGASFTSLAGLASNTGILNLLGGAIFTTAGDLNNSGTLTLGPGSTLAVTGNFSQDTGGTLQVQLGGAPAGGQFGRLTATGSATLDATLNVSLAGGYTPAVGDSFPVLTFAQHSGDFAARNGLKLGGNLVLQPVYEPASQPTSLNLVAGPIVTVSGIVLSPVEGQSFSGPVATVTDADPTAAPANFTATIAWGDGTTTDGSIAQPGGPGTPFQVTGSHPYAEEGNATVTVTVHDKTDNLDVPANTQAQVADAPLTATGQALSATAGTAVNTSVATFTDAGGTESAGNYTGTIGWGDGSVPSVGVVSLAGTTLQVAGSHTYATGGTFTIQVTMKDEGGQSTTVTATAQVTTPTPPPSSPTFTSATGTNSDHATLRVSTAFSLPLAASGWPAPTVSESPTDVLPNGVSFNPATGVLSGTPAPGSGGTYTLHFTAHNGAGADATQTIVLTVQPVVTARLVKIRHQKGLMVAIFEDGRQVRAFRSPFQPPAFKNVQVSVRASNSDGVPDQVVLTATKRRKTVTVSFPG
jgi:fibronectin-binding autotransporter adhesin